MRLLLRIDTQPLTQEPLSAAPVRVDTGKGTVQISSLGAGQHLQHFGIDVVTDEGAQVATVAVGDQVVLDDQPLSTPSIRRITAAAKPVRSLPLVQ